jgi:hypothetical protein
MLLKETPSVDGVRKAVSFIGALSISLAYLSAFTMLLLQHISCSTPYLSQSAQERGNCEPLRENREGDHGKGNRDNRIVLRQFRR